MSSLPVSEDELQRNLLEVYLSHDPECSFTLSDESCDCDQREVSEHLAELIRTRERSLIERIDKEVIGEDEGSGLDETPNSRNVRLRRNGLKSVQRSKLAALRKELE